MNARLRYGARSMLLELVMVATAVAFVFPIYVLLMVSLKPGSDVADDPLGLPRSCVPRQLRRGVDVGVARPGARQQFDRRRAQHRRSLAVGGRSRPTPSPAPSAVAGTASYLLVLLGLMMPLQLGMVPLYALMRDLGLLQTYTSLILFYTGSQLPLTMFLYAGFVRALPRQLRRVRAHRRRFALQGLPAHRLPAAAPGDGHRHHPERHQHLERLPHAVALCRRQSAADAAGRDLLVQGRVRRAVGRSSSPASDPCHPAVLSSISCCSGTSSRASPAGSKDDGPARRDTARRDTARRDTARHGGTRRDALSPRRPPSRTSA